MVGASRGIGRAIAGAFADEGASLFLMGRSQERLDEVGAMVSQGGSRAPDQTIAIEHASDGIRANCIAPGVIDAGISDDVFAHDPGMREPAAAMDPLGRMGEAEEVAEAAVWLASDASSFTTGTTLAVDGGFLA